MMIISKGPRIKCQKCQKQYEINSDNFGEPDISSDERNMGSEFQYTWEHEFSCIRCSNELIITVEGYEYPVGAFNYKEFNTRGCILVEEPVLEIQHIEDYYNEDDDIR